MVVDPCHRPCQPEALHGLTHGQGIAAEQQAGVFGCQHNHAPGIGNVAFVYKATVAHLYAVCGLRPGVYGLEAVGKHIERGAYPGSVDTGESYHVAHLAGIVVEYGVYVTAFKTDIPAVLVSFVGH